MYVRMFTFIGALPGGGSSGSEGASEVPSSEFLAGQIQELSIMLSDLAKEMLAKGSTNSTGSDGSSSGGGSSGGSSKVRVVVAVVVVVVAAVVGVVVVVVVVVVGVMVVVVVVVVVVRLG